mmetsp:Transcript_16527/g.40644  ORF Transcript_16527/g.40644 Transcript_16527/m.40644 type:complete len:246 (-) Transcript_16527:590-1327(-)
MRFGILLVIIGRLAFIVKLEVELGSAEVRASLLAAARQEEAVLHVRLPLARLHIVPTMQRSVDLVQRLREAGSIRRREEDVDLLLTAEAQHVDVETRGMAVKHEDDGALDLLLVKVLVEGLERVQPGCTRLVPLGSSTLEESRASRAELVEDRLAERLRGHVGLSSSSALDLALPLMRLSAALIRLEGDFDGDAAFFAMRLRCFAKVHSTPRSIRPPGTCMPSACVLALVAGIRPALLVHGTDAG